jgi:integrase
MTPDQALVPIDPTAIQPIHHTGLDLAIAGWLDAKEGKSHSARTRTAYEATITSYRAALLRAGLDLDAPPEQARAMALVAQAWGGSHVDGLAVAPATYNQRIAIVSSFFTYAARLALIPDGNPIASYVDRRAVDVYGSAEPLDPAHVAGRLATIDRLNPAGARDYALLSVALSTGRRRAELAALRWRDLTIAGERITIHWARTKGGHSMRDTLGKAPAAAVLAWLQLHYGAQLGTLAPDAPIWVTLAPKGRGGALSDQAIADVCMKWLGISKVHALRHTFAHTMTKAGAGVSDVQRRLGHANLSTTDRYLKQLSSNENPYADGLAALLGID